MFKISLESVPMKNVFIHRYRPGVEEGQAQITRYLPALAVCLPGTDILASEECVLGTVRDRRCFKTAFPVLCLRFSPVFVFLFLLLVEGYVVKYFSIFKMLSRIPVSFS